MFWKRVVFGKKKNRKLRQPGDSTLARLFRFLKGLTSKKNSARQGKGRIRKILKETSSYALQVGRVLGMITLVLSVGGCLYKLRSYLYHSSSFSIGHITVSPLKYVSAETSSSLTNLYMGRNIFEVDIRALEKQWALLPNVEWVHVRRQMPNVLVVDVVEHEPVGIASLDRNYMIDAQGVPYRCARKEEEGLFPVVTGITRSWYQTHKEHAEALLRQAVFFLKLYHGHHEEYARPKIEEVRLVFHEEGTESIENLVLYLESGIEVWLDGRSSQSMRQGLVYFDSIWRNVGKKKPLPAAILINNRAHPDWIIVRGAEEEPLL